MTIFWADENDRRRADRREADALRMEMFRHTDDEIRAIKSKFDEVLRNQEIAKQQHEITAQRLDLVSEALGIDERGRHTKGGIAETFTRLSGIKMALVWLTGSVIAVMGLYSTVKEIGQRWLGP